MWRRKNCVNLHCITTAKTLSAIKVKLFTLGKIIHKYQVWVSQCANKGQNMAQGREGGHNVPLSPNCGKLFNLFQLLRWGGPGSKCETAGRLLISISIMACSPAPGRTKWTTLTKLQDILLFQPTCFSGSFMNSFQQFLSDLASCKVQLTFPKWNLLGSYIRPCP